MGVLQAGLTVAEEIHCLDQDFKRSFIDNGNLSRTHESLWKKRDDF
jgi:hypothetical protein